MTNTPNASETREWTELLLLGLRPVIRNNHVDWPGRFPLSSAPPCHAEQLARRIDFGIEKGKLLPR